MYIRTFWFKKLQIKKMNSQICIKCHAMNPIVYDYQESKKVCKNCGLVYEENVKSPAHENYTNEVEQDPAINDELNNSSESL